MSFQGSYSPPLPSIESQFLPAQSLASSLLHIDFAPHISDSSLLLTSKMHHDVRSESLGRSQKCQKQVCLLLEGVAFYSLLLTLWPLVPLSTWKSLVKAELCPLGVESDQKRVSSEDCALVCDHVFGSQNILPLFAPSS